MVIPCQQTRNDGFSLIELLVVIVIMGILMSMATLPFQEMIANQRLRTVSSDLTADLALARVEAIKRSTRVGITRTTAQWVGGWQVFDDANRNGVWDAGEGVLVSRPALDNTVKVCSVGTNVDNSIKVLSFGADGRVRTFNDDGTEKTGVRGITISSTLISPSVPARLLEFSPTGRITTVSGVTACP